MRAFNKQSNGYEESVTIKVQSFIFEETMLKDVVLFTPFFASDKRGSFSLFFEKDAFTNIGIDMEPFECFESESKKNVIRGLHFLTTHPQSKIIRVLSGEIYDVVVDLRLQSSTFCKWQAFSLSRENKKMLYIPPGFAHGFLSLSKSTVVQYICGGRYYPEYDSGINYNDGDLRIDWPISNRAKIILSEKDAKLHTLAEYKKACGLI